MSNRWGLETLYLPSRFTLVDFCILDMHLERPFTFELSFAGYAITFTHLGLFWGA
jgi:hypothetical protein